MASETRGLWPPGKGRAGSPGKGWVRGGGGMGLLCPYLYRDESEASRVTNSDSDPS